MHPNHSDVRSCQLAVDKVEDITVAVELKFLTPYLPPGAAESTTQNEYISVPHSRYAEAGDQLQEMAFTSIANTIEEVSSARAMSCYELQRLGMQEKDVWESCWIVKKSNSAEPTRDDPLYDGYLWVPVEINSPMIPGNENEIRPLIEAVLGGIKSRHRIVTNHTCELHVHVGRKDCELFSLLTMKKLATLCWLGEPILRTLKDPKSPNFNHTYTWSSPMTQHSRLAMALRNKEDQALVYRKESGCLNGLMKTLRGEVEEETTEQGAAIKAIWRTRSHLELGRLLSGCERQYRRLGFNFSALGQEDERARRGPKTVEFRFLEGPLSDEIVLAWIHICSILVETCVAEGGIFNHFQGALRWLWTYDDKQPMDHNFATLMEELGVESDIYKPLQSKIRNDHGLIESGDMQQGDTVWSNGLH